MAEGGRTPRKGKAKRPPEPPKALREGRTPEGYEPLVTALGGTLDFRAMLAIADLLPVMIAYFDTGCVYRFINKPFAEWLGRPRSKILGRHSREIIGDEAFDARKAMIDQALAGQRTFFASEFDHPTRGPVAVQSDYVPWASPDGEVRGIILLVTEVTEQRVTEKALRESEARFRRIANSAPAMMWVTRLDRVRDFVNDHYVEFVLGPEGSREEARTVDWRTRIHPDDHDRIVAGSIAGEASGAP